MTTMETSTTYMSGPGKIVAMKFLGENPGGKSRDYLYPLSISSPLCVGNSLSRGVIMEGGISGGGIHTKEVIMRKRSENRGYTDENIRDSIVMGDISSNFPDLGMV